MHFKLAVKTLSGLSGMKITYNNWAMKQFENLSVLQKKESTSFYDNFALLI